MKQKAQDSSSNASTQKSDTALSPDGHRVSSETGGIFGEYLVPMFLTLVIHAGVIALLVWHWDSIKPHKTIPPKSISATLVKMKSTSTTKPLVAKQKQDVQREQQKKLEQQKAEQQQKEQALKLQQEQKLARIKQAEEAEKKRLTELEEKKKAEVEAKKKAEAEKEELRLAELAKKKKAEEEAKKKAEDKRLAELEEKKKVEAEKKAKAEKKRLAELEKKKKEEAQKKAKAEAEKKRKAEQEQLLADLAAEEEELLQESIDSESAASHIQVIKGQVVSVWNYPLSANPNLKVGLKIHLLPTGEVDEVNIVQRSGDPSFDRSAEQAVFKASPLSVPDDPRLFEREFRTITFIFEHPGSNS